MLARRKAKTKKYHWFQVLKTGGLPSERLDVSSKMKKQN
jgi:hypothetical protein